MVSCRYANRNIGELIMYFSKEFLLNLYIKLSSLYSGNDIEAQGGTQFVSELKYFLAMDYFKKQKGKTCDTNLKEDKDFFVSSVGKIVLLADDGSFLATKNFANSIGEARDFDVGSNFFSANTVAKSKISTDPQKFPNRHPQLLWVTKGVIDTYSGGYENLANNKDYLGGSTRNYAILFLWLNRFFNFDSKDSIYNDSLVNLQKEFSSELVTALQWTSSEVKSEVEKMITDASFVETKSSFEKKDLENKEISKEITRDIINPHNRIIFGAPGTGKSHKLKIESEQFTNQEIVKTDISQQIKDEINAVIKLSGKLNFLSAIGVKFADYLKTKSKKELSTEFNLSGVDELYLGSRAKIIAEKIPVDEEVEDKEEQIKDLVQRRLTEKDLLVNLMAIGIRFSDYLCTSSMTDLKKTYDLKSDAQMWWLYRGAQAVQAIGQEPDKQPVKYLERVTFHPNYSYAQFVGTYKPVKSSLNPEDISYEYVPGPFMKVYINAKKNPEKNFLLLIEEINRANVAAVFGDIFQLLDRKEDGNSEYPISASEDQKLFIESYGIKESEISIPSNMYIWATMNSADQGVFPMDTAFKRRWEFEYIGIDENEKEVKDYEIPLCKNDTVSKKIYWNELRKALNDKLISLGVNEDKLLGPFFLSKSVLESAMSKGMDFVKLFESKVLMYLFEDAAKMKVRQLFNLDSGKYIYSEVCKKFEKDGLDVFFLESAVTLSDLKEESQNE